MNERVRKLVWCLGALVAMPGAAHAAGYGYEYAVSGLIGPSAVVENEDYEDDLSFGGAIRTNFGGPGVEFSVLYTQIEGSGSSDSDDLDVKLDLLSFGLAGRYDIRIPLVDLYALIGADLYLNDLSGRAVSVGGGGTAVGVSVDSVDLGLTVGAGAALRLGDAFSIGPEIRYRRLLTDEFADDDALKGTGLDERIGMISVLARISFHYR